MLRVEVADRSAEFATVGSLARAPVALAEIAAQPDGIPLIWHDPWAAVVAGGHQYAIDGEHPGADVALQRDAGRALPARRAARGARRGHAGARGAAHRGLATARRDRGGRDDDPARARLAAIGRAPHQGLLPRAGDGREGAQPRPPAAPPRDAAPRRVRRGAARRRRPGVVGRRGRRARHLGRAAPRARPDRARGRQAQRRPGRDARRSRPRTARSCPPPRSSSCRRTPGPRPTSRSCRGSAPSSASDRRHGRR